MNNIYKFFLTISSTLWFLVVWGIKFLLNLPKQENLKCEIIIWILCVILLAIPIFVSLFLKIFICCFSKEEIKNIKSCNLADNEFLPVYLGYFFVALGIDNLKLLVLIYFLILIFTFVSNTQYFNPTYLLFGYHTYHAETEQGTQIVLIIKGKIIRNKDDIKKINFYRLNDTTYISKKIKENKNG